MKILFLTPWYPSEKDAMSGLFVHKHAEAVRAQGVDVAVLSAWTWKEFITGWRHIRRTWGLPDVVQLNVIQKEGLLALWLKKRYNIPYIIVEHWSGYLPENEQFMRLPAWKKRLYQHIAKECTILLTVSDTLRQAMQQCGIQASRWGRINNVVDDFFFEPSAVSRQKSDRKTLLHVSCYEERAKNVKGLLRAAKALSELRQDWQLVLVGTGVDYIDVRTYAESLNFPEGLLKWTGELTPQKVAEAFDNADIFILPSNYENAPVVLSESIVKGVPIIATRVGGIPEMVNEQCGILVTPGNDNELTQTMNHMLDHYKEYNHNIISELGKQYAFSSVGMQLKEIYTHAIETHT